MFDEGEILVMVLEKEWKSLSDARLLQNIIRERERERAHKTI